MGTSDSLRGSVVARGLLFQWTPDREPLFVYPRERPWQVADLADRPFGPSTPHMSRSLDFHTVCSKICIIACWQFWKKEGRKRILDTRARACLFEKIRVS